jgi:hypothetical protein
MFEKYKLFIDLLAKTVYADVMTFRKQRRDEQ